MQIESNFIGWDFTHTWAFGSDGFPTLINLPNTWLGVDTNWNNTANWSFGVLPSANLPDAKEFVSIPSGLNNYPVLTAGVTTYSVIIEAGASLTTNSYTLTNTFLVATLVNYMSKFKENIGTKIITSFNWTELFRIKIT